MKKMKTEVIFILDKSGSMGGLEKDTIGGFNSMLDKQKKVKGEARLTTVLFDHGYYVLHDGVDIQNVRPMTENDYQVGGTTALLDAVGLTINRIKKRIKTFKEKPEQVVCIIITDGEENSSCEFTKKKVKKMIEKRMDKNWEFIFLGANIDAIKTANQYGIKKDFAVNYHADKVGTKVSYETVSKAVACLRETKSIDKDWKKEVEQDYKKRVRY